MVLHGMQGTPYIYQGEEIGMTNPGFSTIGQYRDVESLNMYAELSAQGKSEAELLAILANKSRDNSRTPMQWNAAPNAGFTQGTPWINCAKNYPQINTEAALADQNSVFYTYRQLIALRKQCPLLTHGDYQDLAPSPPSLWCYQRSWNSQCLLVVANLSHEPLAWGAEGVELSARWHPLISNYADAAQRPQAMTLRPFEAIWWLLED